MAEGRIFEGVCVDRSMTSGFLTDEVLAYFGGESLVVHECQDCPANVLANKDARMLAGCFGLFDWSNLQPSFFRVIDEVAREKKFADPICHCLHLTSPAWYGLWMSSPLDNVQTELIAQILTAAAGKVSHVDQSLHRLIAALNVCRDHELLLHVSMSPTGKASDRSWTTGPHCPRCKAEMTEKAKHCRVCGRTGGPNPARRRNARGTRPYQPLHEILGAPNVEPFLQRYRNRSIEPKRET